MSLSRPRCFLLLAVFWPIVVFYYAAHRIDLWFRGFDGTGMRRR